MVEDRVDRRLAAIFAGDIAGYSRLMGVDEEGTLRQLKAHRKELVDPKLTLQVETDRAQCLTSSNSRESMSAKRVRAGGIHGRCAAGSQSIEAFHAQRLADDEVGDSDFHRGTYAASGRCLGNIPPMT